jgi:hypothetical protein
LPLKPQGGHPDADHHGHRQNNNGAEDCQ